MSLFNFYEIKSQKSSEFVKGVRKTSLACFNQPDLHLFLWLDQNENLKHLQFLFDENLLEWFDGQKGLLASETNRKDQVLTDKTGIQKGARTIHSTRDRTVIKRGLQIINAAKFPESYDHLIRMNLLLPYITNPGVKTG
jgi:hypothetical protein